MIVTNEGLLPPSSAVMRSLAYVRLLAKRMRDEPGGATAKYGRVVTTVHDWTISGEKILTPHRSEIDMMASHSWRDPHVYPFDGGPVFKELLHFRLLDPACAFHADPKRTMLRIMAKADQEAWRALDIRLLSGIFWISAYLAIQDHKAGA